MKSKDDINNNELVSIIVPIYNAEKYLEKCIKSLLDQTYKKIELILVDDGSEDDSLKICNEFAKKYSFIKVYHKRNAGVSCARNYGIKKASGKYIFFVDSDDWVSEDFVEKLMICDNEDFVQGGCKGNLGNMLKSDIFEDIARYWFESPAQFVWSNCYKKDIIKEHSISFDETVFLGEDGRFNIEYLKHVKSIRRTSELPYHHYDNKESAVHKLYINRLELQKQECQMIENLSKKRESLMRIKWYYWHIVLKHYYYHLAKDESDSRLKKELVGKIKQTFKESYFRESIDYIRNNGSIDEKLESYLMGYGKYKIYCHLMKLLQQYLKRRDL